MAGLITQATAQPPPVDANQTVTGKVTPQVTDPVYTQPGMPMPGTPEDGPSPTGAVAWDGSVNGLVPGGAENTGPYTQPGEVDPTGGTGVDPNIGGDGPSANPPTTGDPGDGTGLVTGAENNTPGGDYSTNPNAGADPGPYQGNTDWNTITGQTDMMNEGLINLLDSNNPLMQRAALTGRRAANARGLGSSSFSERAAQGAVFDIALPMVQQASQQAAAFENLARQQGFASSQAMLDRQLREFEQTRDIEFREWMQNTTLQHQELLQTSELAQYSYSNFMNAAMEILNNPDTTDEQKEAAMTQLQRALDNSLALLNGTSNVDLSAFLPGGYQGQPPTTGNPNPGGGGGVVGDGGGAPIGGTGGDGVSINNVPISNFGTINPQGGLDSISPNGINWSDSWLGQTIDNAGTIAKEAFTDSVIVDMLEEAYPDIFDKDSVWTAMLGLGVNLAATPINILTNLVGMAWDWVTGNETIDEGSNNNGSPGSGDTGDGGGDTGSIVSDDAYLEWLKEMDGYYPSWNPYIEIRPDPNP